MPQTAYSDISNRTAAFAAVEMLRRATPYLIFEKYGQAKPIPTNSTKVVKFRRYEALDNTVNELVEGVTPTAKKLTVSDVEATLRQYGDLVTLTDVILDTHEDPILREGVKVLGEQAAQMIEKMRFGILRAGTNVFYANGTARGDVNTKLTRILQRRITRTLKRNMGDMLTDVVRSTPAYGTQNIAPSYIAICHPDCESDIRDMDGFKDVIDYGSLSPMENEIGSVEGVRYIYSTLIEPWADAGGTAGSMLSTTGTDADVYPILFVARDAYGIVPLKGKAALTPMVVNAKPSKSDPLGQRAHISWKSMQTCVILNQSWMVRAEVAVTA